MEKDIYTSSNLQTGLTDMILAVCKCMTDSWGVLSDQEKAKIIDLANNTAADFKPRVERLIGRMVDAEQSRETMHFSALMKSISRKQAVVTLSLEVPATDVPLETYIHNGGFLCILTNHRTTLEEFEKQGAWSFEADAEK